MDPDGDHGSGEHATGRRAQIVLRDMHGGDPFQPLQELVYIAYSMAASLPGAQLMDPAHSYPERNNDATACRNASGQCMGLVLAHRASCIHFVFAPRPIDIPYTSSGMTAIATQSISRSQSKKALYLCAICIYTMLNCSHLDCVAVNIRGKGDSNS
jgi:hypothetical protein